MIQLRFSLLFIFLVLVLNPVIFSYGLENQNNDESNPLIIFRDVGIPLITLLVGALSAKYIVGSWQTRKEISDIRNEILINYTNSFKNYLTILDTFVAKLVMEFAQFSDSRPSHKTSLSKLLPWGFTFNDLNYYSTKVPIDSKFTDYENKSYRKDIIIKKFEELHAVNKESYIHFDLPKLNEFKDKNEISFKTDFYQTRSKVFEFKANLSQYYGGKGSITLSDELNAMWEYMMGCYVLVNKILLTRNEQKFIELLEKYNSLGEFLFDMMINFERRLISERIKIN